MDPSSTEPRGDSSERCRACLGTGFLGDPEFTPLYGSRFISVMFRCCPDCLGQGCCPRCGANVEPTLTCSCGYSLYATPLAPGLPDAGLIDAGLPDAGSETEPSPAKEED